MRELVDLPPFVWVEELDGLPGRLVLADTRWYLDGRSGRAAYEEGHLPGAVFVDLDCWLTGPATPAEGRNRALFTGSGSSCSRAWEAPRSTVG